MAYKIEFHPETEKKLDEAMSIFAIFHQKSNQKRPLVKKTHPFCPASLKK